jgi:peptide/nickel transport system ATP-binding protein
MHRADRQICNTTPPALSPTRTGQRAACHFADDVIATGIPASPAQQRAKT